MQNTRVPMFIKETLSQLKSHIDSCTVIVDDFNAPRLSKQNLTRTAQVLDSIISHTALTDIYIAFHKNTKNTLSSQQKLSEKNDPMLGQKASINRFGKLK